MAKALFIIGSVAMLFFIALFAFTSKTMDAAGSILPECSLSTRIDFLRIGDSVQACYAGSNLYFAVENLGSDTISGLSVYLESDYNLTMLIREMMGPGDTKQESLSFGSQGLESAKSLTLYPLVGDISRRNVCRDAAIHVGLEKC
jgi:hypothetical protein